MVGWKHIIYMVCEFCVCFAARYEYDLRTVCWCGIESYICFVYSVLVYQCVTGIFCVMCCGVSACHRFLLVLCGVG